MKTVTLPVQELSELVQMQLESGSQATIVVSGNSMHPMLRHRRDSVTLEKVTGFAKLGDVLFYRRSTEKYVLHRVIQVRAPGEYICSGDNQCDHERVLHDQVIARAICFTNRGRQIACDDPGYRFYVWCFVKFMFLRYPYIRARRALGRLIKRLKNSKF